MKKQLFLILILLFIPIVYALDSELIIPCGGDSELIIGCLGDNEDFFVGKIPATATTLIEESHGGTGYFNYTVTSYTLFESFIAKTKELMKNAYILFFTLFTLILIIMFAIILILKRSKNAIRI